MNTEFGEFVDIFNMNNRSHWCDYKCDKWLNIYDISEHQPDAYFGALDRSDSEPHILYQ